MLSVPLTPLRMLHMPTNILLTHQLASEYQQLFKNCHIRPHRQSAVNHLAHKITLQQRRYQLVERATTVPWQMVAVIHALESSLRFHRHLHNGDPLHSRTVQVPANRPLSAPPFTWEESAIDALHYTKLANWQDWSIAGTLFKLEAYNGWGYRRYHKSILSPYLWSFSNHYTQGKYASDGKFDSQLISQQCGGAVLLKELLTHPSSQTKANALSTAFNSKFNIKHSTLLLTPYPNRLIKTGERQRSVVKSIQQRLNTLGYQPKLHIDGYFGPKTEQAVKWLQSRSTTTERALQVDGIVGVQTWTVLFGTA